MLNFNLPQLKTKKMSMVLAVMTCLNVVANAQFYDLNEAAEPEIPNYNSNVYQQSNEPVTTHPLFAEGVEENPNLETSGDENGFIPESNPDTSIKYTQQQAPQNEFAFPVAEGLDSFSGMIAEEKIDEKLRDLTQLDSIGFLDSNFDEFLWKGVSFELLQEKLSNISSNKIGSIHIEKILRNMLLAKTQAPQMPEGQSWLAFRMNTLNRLGYLSDVELLMKDIKERELLLLNNPQLTNLYLQVNALNPGIDSLIRKSLSQDSSNVSYKKYLLLNLYKQGKINQAKLTFQALTDFDSNVKKSVFAKLYSALLNNEMADLIHADRNLDIFEQYVIALKPELFKNVKYYTFKDKILVDAIEATNELSTKTEIAETLMNTYPYSYNIDTLVKVYEEYKFAVQQLSVPLKFLQISEDKHKNRALLFQSSKNASLNSTKALSLKKLWESYENNDLQNLKTLVNERTQGILLNSSIAWFSKDVLKEQLLRANIDLETLKVLYQNMDQVNNGVQFLDLQIALEFLRRTSVIGVNFDSIQEYKDTLYRWFNANKLDSSENYEYVLKVLTLLDAMQASIPDEIWTELYEKSSLGSTKSEINPIWLRLVSSAIEKGEKGKALLLVIDSFVNKQSSDLDPQTLANIISCLNFLNMSQEVGLIGLQAILTQ